MAIFRLEVLAQHLRILDSRIKYVGGYLKNFIALIN